MFIQSVIVACIIIENYVLISKTLKKKQLDKTLPYEIENVE